MIIFKKWLDHSDQKWSKFFENTFQKNGGVGQSEKLSFFKKVVLKNDLFSGHFQKKMT